MNNIIIIAVWSILSIIILSPLLKNASEEERMYLIWMLIISVIALIKNLEKTV